MDDSIANFLHIQLDSSYRHRITRETRVIAVDASSAGAVNRLRLANLSTPLSRAHLACDVGAVARSANARRARSARMRLSRSHFGVRGIARVG